MSKTARGSNGGFIGTLVLVLLATVLSLWWFCSAQARLGKSVNGGFTNITLGWGLRVTPWACIWLVIYRRSLEPAVHINAGHLPVFPWRKTVPYIVARKLPVDSSPPLSGVLELLPAFHAKDRGWRKRRECSPHFQLSGRLPLRRPAGSDHRHRDSDARRPGPHR
jgi:glycerol uptake facilitator protein